MQNKYEIYVDYYIRGFDFDPDKITELTGVEPTKVSRVGSPVSWASRIKSGVIPKIKVNQWKIKSNLDPLTDLDTQVRVLIQNLQPGWAEFVKLGSQYGGVFSCVVWDYSDSRPAICFDNDIIKVVAELNAGIQVSVYSLEKEESDS
jgi:hypothetical protein